MAHDPVYLADVSSALRGALHEAQDLVQAGNRGKPLADLIRHARELHGIMAEELAASNPTLAGQGSRALIEMGEQLQSLERALGNA